MFAFGSRQSQHLLMMNAAGGTLPAASPIRLDRAGRPGARASAADVCRATTSLSGWPFRQHRPLSPWA